MGSPSEQLQILYSLDPSLMNISNILELLDFSSSTTLSLQVWDMFSLAIEYPFLRDWQFLAYLIRKLNLDA